MALSGRLCNLAPAWPGHLPYHALEACMMSVVIQYMSAWNREDAAPPPPNGAAVIQPSPMDDLVPIQVDLE